MTNYFKFYFGSKDPLTDELPWMTYKAIRWLNKNVYKNSKVFEWGSGGSTIFFANKCSELISIEHDDNWYKKVKKHFTKHTRNSSLIYKLIRPEKGKHFHSSSEIYRGKSFENYCKYINKYPNNFFDFVIVDGRARNGCIMVARRKVKPGGYLVLDNSEREEYKKGIRMLSKWKRVDFFGKGPVNPYSWQTSIFVKE